MRVVIAVGFGLILGSFLSVLLERLGRKGGIVAGRSECPHCHHVLAASDLVPLLSYLFLRGRCRYCGEPISPLYPILELTMAAVFGIYVFRFGVPTVWYLVDLAVLFGMVALLFFDATYMVLPDGITYPMLGVVILRLFTVRPDLIVGAVATGALLAALFGLVYVVSHGRLVGFGDVKLAGLIGVLFGFPVAVGVTLVAVWAGALFGVILMAVGKADMKTPIPFGSFWAGAAILTMLWPGPIAFVSGLVIPTLR